MGLLLVASAVIALEGQDPVQVQDLSPAQAGANDKEHLPHKPQYLHSQRQTKLGEQAGLGVKGRTPIQGNTTTPTPTPKKASDPMLTLISWPAVKDKCTDDGGFSLVLAMHLKPTPEDEDSKGIENGYQQCTESDDFLSATIPGTVDKNSVKEVKMPEKAKSAQVRCNHWCTPKAQGTMLKSCMLKVFDEPECKGDVIDQVGFDIGDKCATNNVQYHVPAHKSTADCKNCCTPAEKAAGTLTALAPFRISVMIVIGTTAWNYLV